MQEEGVLDQLKNFGMRKGYALALKKGISCPDCGQRVALPSEMPVGGLKARFGCSKCEWEGTILETMEFGQMPDSPLKEKPVGSRILKRGDRWVCPGTGRVNGEWLFGLVWMGVIITAAVVLLFFVEGGPGWMGMLFLSPFFAVGFWMLYEASRKTFGETEVRINRTDVRVSKRLFGVTKEERIAIGKITGVKLVKSSEDESGWSACLIFERKDEKDLKVELEISIDEKRWLLGEWQEKLGMSEERESRDESGVKFMGRAIQEKGLELEPQDNGNFFLTVRNRVAPWVLFGGGLMAVVGVVLVVSGGWAMGDGPVFFEMVGLFFSGVGLVFGLIPLLAGVGGLIWGIRKVGEVKKYAFYPDRIEFTTVQRGGRLSRSGSLPREMVKRVVMTQSGYSNDEARYMVQIRASENLTLLYFNKREVAEEVTGWVRQWIERD